MGQLHLYPIASGYECVVPFFMGGFIGVSIGCRSGCTW